MTLREQFESLKQNGYICDADNLPPREWSDGKMHEKKAGKWHVVGSGNSENQSKYKDWSELPHTQQNVNFSGNKQSESERKEQLKNLSPLEINTTDFKGKTDKECRAIAKQKYSKLDYVEKDGIRVDFKPIGYKETKSHSADKNVLYVLGDMDKLIKQSVFMFVEPNTDEDKNNTLNFLNYAAKTKINGSDYYVRILIREDRDGNFYYDNENISVEKIKGVLESPTNIPTVGVNSETPYVDRIAQWLAGVKLNVNNKHDRDNQTKDATLLDIFEMIKRDKYA